MTSSQKNVVLGVWLQIIGFGYYMLGKLEADEPPSKWFWLLVFVAAFLNSVLVTFCFQETPYE